jgi:cytochrome o ubiquinol oxidase subunit 2
MTKELDPVFLLRKQPLSVRIGSSIAPAARCGGAFALLALTGCEPGILPSQGIVGKGNTQIMIDSLAIMLVIVVPTIVATLAFAW